MPANDVRYALEALAKVRNTGKENNPPNGSLEMIQDQPIQQSRGKELNFANGSLWICSVQPSRNSVGSGTTFAIGFACPNRLDLKYPQTAVCGIFARASLACR